MSLAYAVLVGEYDDLVVFLGELLDALGHVRMPPLPVLGVFGEFGSTLGFDERVVHVEAEY